MSLSRPVKFPLLKLPWLCIKDVVKNWDIFDIIIFAVISKKTRQIVRNLKIPLNGIRIFLSDRKCIELGSSWQKWHFRNISESLLHEQQQNSSKFSFVLQNNAIPLYTRKTGPSLDSYSNENEITALKMAMEFLNEVFKCSVERVEIYNDNFPELGDIGVKSTVNLNIGRHFGYGRSQELSLLLENLEVTGTCNLHLNNKENGFYVDPKLFKCKGLVFSMDSGAWVTRETLLQFEVPQLSFYHCPFSVEDIVSFVTNWFHSDNKKLEYLFITNQDIQISLENFQTEELKPIPFSGRHRVPSIFRYIDFSEGLEVVRHDGLVATIYVKGRDFLFCIWHDQ